MDFWWFLNWIFLSLPSQLSETCCCLVHSRQLAPAVINREGENCKKLTHSFSLSLVLFILLSFSLTHTPSHTHTVTHTHDNNENMQDSIQWVICLFYLRNLNVLCMNMGSANVYAEMPFS
jgi:hypothetical protein